MYAELTESTRLAVETMAEKNEVTCLAGAIRKLPEPANDELVGAPGVSVATNDSLKESLSCAGFQRSAGS